MQKKRYAEQQERLTWLKNKSIRPSASSCGNIYLSRVGLPAFPGGLAGDQQGPLELHAAPPAFKASVGIATKRPPREEEETCLPPAYLRGRKNGVPI